MKHLMLLATVLLSGVLLSADAPKGNAADAKAKGAKAGESREKVEARAMRVVKNAVSLFAQNEDERAVGLLEAVGRMYPDSETRFVANLITPSLAYFSTTSSTTSGLSAEISSLESSWPTGSSESWT